MDKDDTAELLWKSGQVVRSTQAQRPTSDPPILRGSGSGGNAGEEENDPLPLLPPPPYQSILIHEEEMASWFRHPLPQDYYGSGLLYSGGIASTPATQVEIPVSLAPTPSAPHDFSTGQIIAENFMNLSMLRGNIITGGRVEAGSLIPVVRDSTQVDASATPSSSATVIRGVSPTFAVPGHGQVFEIAGTSSSWICKVETEPIQVQPATETEITNDRKRKERLDDIEETKEARGSASRKRSRAAEMYNLSERRRREKMNERIKVLQELIPRCNKSDKVSVLDDVIEYVKSIQMHVRILQNKRCGMVEHGKSFHESNLWGLLDRFCFWIHLETPGEIYKSYKSLLQNTGTSMTSMGQYHNMMYSPNMQQFMAMGMMGMNRPSFVPFPGTPFPRPAHIASLGPSSALPYSYPNTQAFDPSGVHMPSPLANQPQFPGYMNPYGQFVGPQQTQQPPPPPLQHQTSSLLSFVQASSSKEPEYQDNQPTSG